MKAKFYEGRLGYENYLFNQYLDYLPHKDDMILYNDTTYKVMYSLYETKSDEYDIYVRKTIEEDY